MFRRGKKVRGKKFAFVLMAAVVLSATLAAPIFAQVDEPAEPTEPVEPAALAQVDEPAEPTEPAEPAF